MKFWNRRKKIRSREPTARPFVWVHEALIGCSVRLLRRSNNDRAAHEGIVYWAGRNVAKEWIISTCISPRAQTSRGSFETSSASNAEVVSFLAKNKLELLAQVHSHPSDLVGHSAGDDSGALMPYENFLSIVVPSYGRLGILPFTQCGVHRFEKGRFRRLSNEEVQDNLGVLPLFHDFTGEQ